MQRLYAMAGALDDRDLVFEAGVTRDLALRLEAFADDDGSALGFAGCWEELEEWAGAAVYRSGREKSLCSIPELPSDFAC